MTADITGDFGRYLACVAERDIDLLLMEEFHVDDSFVRWFGEQVGAPNATPDGAWHSVSDTDGETDLLLRVESAGRQVGILIENKIGAPEQDQQAERYHLRGMRSQEAGKFSAFVTVMCAPERYLSALSDDSVYQHTVSYEAIAAWFASHSGKRSEWRHQIMLEAIDQSRRGYTMAVNAVNSRFHREYWEHLVRRHPQLLMARPGDKGSKSNWIIMKGAGFPKGVKIHHKIDQCTLELGFERRTVDEILSRTTDLPNDIRVMQKGKTASLVVDVPPMRIDQNIQDQEGPLETALAVAHRLIPHARMFDDDPNR